MKAIEIVTWKAKPGVTDQAMVAALNALVPDLEQLPGFISQTASKKDDGSWVDIYYWASSDDAQASNERLADKETLIHLLSLIDMQTVSMEIYEILQGAPAIC